MTWLAFVTLEIFFMQEQNHKIAELSCLARVHNKPWNKCWALCFSPGHKNKHLKLVTNYGKCSLLVNFLWLSLFEDIGLYFLVFTAAPNHKLQVKSAETKTFIRKSRFAVGAVSSVYRLKRLENENKGERIRDRFQSRYYIKHITKTINLSNNRRQKYMQSRSSKLNTQEKCSLE